MRPLRCAVLTTALALLALVGCSGEQDGSPTSIEPAFLATPGSSAKAVGPSEIVLALDLSDSLSADRLQEVVDGTAACLNDARLFPANGSVTLQILVYGDTTAALLEQPLRVTENNVADTIVPALQALSTDRMVGGGGQDLSGALDQARAVLEQAAVADRHVLVVSTGGMDDPQAFLTACENLRSMGVLVSSIAVDADLDELARLAECSEGGFVGGYTGSVFSPLCTDALAYMLVAQLDASPESAEVSPGDEHAVVAEFFRGFTRGEYPLVGETVDFAVAAGPNSGLTGQAVTDTLGRAAFTYLGEGGAGRDVILVTALHPGTGTALADTVTATWSNTAPVCEAGGPYEAAVTADTLMLRLDGSLSRDDDGDTLTYAWSLNAEGAFLDDPAAVSPVLTLTGASLCGDSLLVQLTVGDGTETSACSAVVRLDDRRPPRLVAVEEPVVLWPPNHKYHAFTPGMLLVAAEDACGGALDLSLVEVVEVSSDEPDDERGDGRTVDDIRIDCDGTVHLRAERMGGGDGRVYTITYRLAREGAEPALATARVVVPHDDSGSMPGEDVGNGWTARPDCGD